MLGGVLSRRKKKKIEEFLERISEQIPIKNYRKIKDYLYKFPDMLDLVPKVIETAKQYFPNEFLVLDIYDDPEYDDRYLILYIKTQNFNESFYRRFKEARDCYLYDLINKKGWIQLMWR
jgi:hypothetical protein